MKIAVLGGSFDPPHFGHKILAEKIINELNFDKVLIIPCFDHDFGKKLSPAKNRLQMTKLLRKKQIEVSDIEIKRGGVSISIDTLIELGKQHPNDNFYWVLGSDQLSDFHKWDYWEKIISDFGLIVAKRDNEKNLSQKIRKDLDLEKLPKEIIILKADIPNISSTEVRERTKQNKSIHTLVPEKVEEYIIKHNLYK